MASGRAWTGKGPALGRMGCMILCRTFPTASGMGLGPMACQTILATLLAPIKVHGIVTSMSYSQSWSHFHCQCENVIIILFPVPFPVAVRSNSAWISHNGWITLSDTETIGDNGVLVPVSDKCQRFRIVPFFICTGLSRGLYQCEWANTRTMDFDGNIVEGIFLIILSKSPGSGMPRVLRSPTWNLLFVINFFFRVATF